MIYYQYISNHWPVIWKRGLQQFGDVDTLSMLPVSSFPELGWKRDRSIPVNRTSRRAADITTPESVKFFKCCN
jgi:hypothetical protein